MINHIVFILRKKKMNFEGKKPKTKNQGTSQPEASQYVNGDMAKEWEELVELDDVQLATVVGGAFISVTTNYGYEADLLTKYYDGYIDELSDGEISSLLDEILRRLSLGITESIKSLR